MDRVSAGHDNVLAAENEIQVTRTVEVLRTEVLFVIMGGEAVDAEIIEELAHLLRLGFAPLEIGSVKLDALVAHLGDSAHRPLWILFKGFANGIQFEANRNGS